MVQTWNGEMVHYGINTYLPDKLNNDIIWNRFRHYIHTTGYWEFWIYIWLTESQQTIIPNIIKEIENQL